LRGGAKPPDPALLPSELVATTLAKVRDVGVVDPVDLRQMALQHWQARAKSAYQLGALKDRRLRQSLWGFVGPFAYFASRLLS
jgi:hypothetical protein